MLPPHQSTNSRSRDLCVYFVFCLEKLAPSSGVCSSLIQRSVQPWMRSSQIHGFRMHMYADKMKTEHATTHPATHTLLNQAEVQARQRTTKERQRSRIYTHEERHETTHPLAMLAAQVYTKGNSFPLELIWKAEEKQGGCVQAIPEGRLLITLLRRDVLETLRVSLLSVLPRLICRNVLRMYGNGEHDGWFGVWTLGKTLWPLVLLPSHYAPFKMDEWMGGWIPQAGGQR